MKKILFISHTLTIGGAQLLLKSVADFMHKQNYDVAVWGPDDGALVNDYKDLNIPCFVQDFEVDRVNRDQEIAITSITRTKIADLINYCSKNNKKLSIRCAGTITNQILDEFDFSKANLVGIFDNNKSLWGKDIKGYKIFPVSDFDNLKPDIVLIAHTKPSFLKSEFRKAKVVSDLFTDTPLKNFLKSVSYLFKLESPVKFFKKINPDIIFVNNARSFWVVIVGKFLGKKVIWNIHENYEPKTFRVFPQFLYLFSFKLADRFIFPSYACYEYYKSLVPERKASIINGGINIEKLEASRSDRSSIREELSIPQDHKVICNIGAMIELKGQSRLVNAGIKLLEKNKDITFIMIGAQETEYSQNLRKIILSSGFENNFKIITNDNNPYKYLNASDIYVCTSFMESFGLVLLEAMYFKKPVIATHTGGIPEIIINNETGLLIPLEDMESHIISNLQKLIDNPDFADMLKEKAYKQLLEKFTIDKMLENYSNTIL